SWYTLAMYTGSANLVRDMYPKELLKAEVSKLYAYNSLILPIVMGINFGKKKKPDKKDIVNGYLPLHGTKIIETVPPHYEFDETATDSTAKEMFEKFVKLATDHHIKLYVVTCPLFIQPFPEPPSIRDIKSILVKYNVPYWNYASDTAFLKRDYFYDYVHPNDKCARPFSAAVASRIKADLAKDSLNNATSQPVSGNQNKITNIITYQKEKH
ncbi:MAG: hypothetical protein ABJA79_05530, partial [Parafilimonas sp.]